MGLLGFFMRRERRVRKLLAEYCQHWIACIGAFREAWNTYLEQGTGDAFDFKVAQTHKLESRTDDLRREIELDLYSKALLPESRGDILGLLETVDRLLSEIEWALYEIQLQEIVIRDEIRPNFQRLVNVACECCELVNEGLRILLVEGRSAGVIELSHKVDALESESDHLERALIRQVFKIAELRTGDKLLLKNLVMLLGRVTDRAENVADRLTLVSVKRRV